MSSSISTVKKMIVVTIAVLLTSTGAAFAVTKRVGGGIWDYGTNTLIGMAWSSYWHRTRNHGSSVSIGANVSSSKCRPGGQTAYVERWRPPFTVAHYYYRFC